MTDPLRVALFGGTFDPPHLGHLIVAERVREALSLDRVDFLVAADPPHKAGIPRSPFADRAAMVDLAVDGNPAFTVDRSEGERPGPSFTVDTLRLRRAERPDEHLWFLIGADSLVDLPTWREPLRILRLARLAVARRPGVEPPLDQLETRLPGLTERVDLIDSPLVDVASRRLRLDVAEGRSVRYRVPDPVAAYIHDRGLYRPSDDPRPSS